MEIGASDMLQVTEINPVSHKTSFGFPLSHYISCPRHLSKTHHPPQYRSLSPNFTLQKKITSVMPQRRTSSIHSQDPSNPGQSSPQDQVNGSEAKPQYPSSFDQKDKNYDDLDESQLRALCQNKGYAKGGRKADLIQRLRNHQAREEESKDFTPAPVSR